MIAPLNCDECKMQARCTCVSTDCKYPEGRQYGVTTYDKMRADERSALEKRLEEAERVIDEAANKAGSHTVFVGQVAPGGFADIYNGLQSYRAKYPKEGK